MTLQRLTAMPGNFWIFLVELWKNRSVLFTLTKKDFKIRYLGSYLGLVWAFIHPVVTVLVLWFVFTYGLKLGGPQDGPKVLWLISGLVPWFFFSEGLGSGAGSIVESSYLVKKVVFRVSFLPIVKLLAAMMIHLIFLAVMLTVFAFSARPPALHALQLIYYLCAAMFLLLGLSWLASSLAVFVRDTAQVISVILQLGFWVAPIIWDLEAIPPWGKVIIQLNPVVYIINGYRDALVNQVWFWQHPLLTIYFWCASGLLFVSGALVFRRLRPHFADVL